LIAWGSLKPYGKSVASMMTEIITDRRYALAPSSRTLLDRTERGDHSTTTQRAA